MYHYVRSEPGLWTVGTDWEPESDHDSAASAARRVAELNGGGSTSCDCVTEHADLRKQIGELWTALRETRNGVGP